MAENGNKRYINKKFDRGGRSKNRAGPYFSCSHEEKRRIR
jgi:hypothetical protein